MRKTFSVSSNALTRSFVSDAPTKCWISLQVPSPDAGTWYPFKCSFRMLIPGTVSNSLTRCFTWYRFRYSQMLYLSLEDALLFLSSPLSPLLIVRLLRFPSIQLRAHVAQSHHAKVSKLCRHPKCAGRLVSLGNRHSLREVHLA